MPNPEVDNRTNTPENLLDTLPTVVFNIKDSIIIASEGSVLDVSDPSMNNGEGGFKTGKVFGKLPKELVSIMPGSVIQPIDFLINFGIKLQNTTIPAYVLLDNRLEQKPILDITKDTVTLKVFGGAASESSIEMAILSKKGFDDADQRAIYQQHISKIMKPVLKHKSESDIYIIEDCIASAETVMGLLATMNQAGWEFEEKTIRIDVAVATAQGLLVLEKFASQNRLNLEINVGFMSFGLSKGIVNNTRTREHANYLTWPNQLLDKMPSDAKERLIKEAIWEDGNIYVVGDMGDAGKSLPQSYDDSVTWNKFRNDSHGERGITSNLNKKEATIDKTNRVVIFLTNGGYWMQALAKHHGVNGFQPIVMSAKRVWSDNPKFGYGVLLNNVPKGFL